VGYELQAYRGSGTVKNITNGVSSRLKHDLYISSYPFVNLLLVFEKEAKYTLSIVLCVCFFGDVT
jgi:hypothetical protein